MIYEYIPPARGRAAGRQDGVAAGRHGDSRGSGKVNKRLRYKLSLLKSQWGNKLLIRPGYYIGYILIPSSFLFVATEPNCYKFLIYINVNSGTFWDICVNNTMLAPANDAGSNIRVDSGTLSITGAGAGGIIGETRRGIGTGDGDRMSRSPG